MRRWVGALPWLGAIAALAYACIPVPDHDPLNSVDASDGSDGIDADDMTPSDASGDAALCPAHRIGPVAVFATVGRSTFDVATGGGRATARFEAEVFDENSDFCDGTTFTAPTPNQYIVCAGMSRMSEGELELRVVTSVGGERRIARGDEAVSGCTVLDMADGETLQIAVVNHAAAGMRFGSDPVAGWIGISGLNNGNSWGTASTISGTSINSDNRVGFTLRDNDGNWNLALDASAANGGSQLLCASLTYPGNLRMEMAISSQPSDDTFTLADAYGPHATGCRIESALGTRVLAVRVTRDPTGVVTGVAEENWVAATALDATSGNQIERGHLGAAAIDPFAPDQSRPLTWGNGSGNLSVPWDAMETTYGPALESGTPMICVSVTVQSKMALDLYVGSQRIEVARGMGFLHGCTVTGLPEGGTVEAKLRNIGPGSAGVAQDMAARWYLVSTH